VIPRVEEFMNTFPFLLDGNPEEPAGRKPSQSRGVDEHIPAGWHGNQEEPDHHSDEKEDHHSDEKEDHHSDVNESVDIFLVPGRETKPVIP